MNCANHPERTATAFCQNCGKPLCPECVRSADGLILCEPCLLTRAAAAASSASSAAYANPGAGGAWQPVTQPGARPGVNPGVHPGAQTGPRPGAQSGYVPVTGAPQTSPGLAALLGFIPGVGAMYNGQFVKALLHVIIFIVLIGTTEHLPLVGILIGAWVFYQVFDAAQTAAARRDGRPLPDPFGILDMSQRLGPQQPTYPPTQFQAPSVGGPTAAQAPQAQYAPPTQYAGQYASQPQPPGQMPAAAAGYPPMQPVPYPPQRRGEPVGAIVLIAVGLLLLLSTLGVLDVDWIWRGWPVLVLLLGVWLLFRRATGVPVAGPGFGGSGSPGVSGSVPTGAVPPEAAHPGAAHPGAVAPAAPAPFSRDNPLSITPRPSEAPQEIPEEGTR